MHIRSQRLGARGVFMGAQKWAQEYDSTFTNLHNMARFQQKQLQEKEQKLLQLYDQQQQRAYQVVQRGSAGSNGSNHGSTIKSTTTTHMTSTSQGGKVRQMFDERRQTTVKGIDRSYPLEPLENKLRKQTTNGLAPQRNGNLTTTTTTTTVNRQSVSVKRAARSDVNSNVNGGKPVVSYREDVTRESFGPSVHRHDDEDEFGSENHVTTFANGHHRHDLDDNEDEALDQETMERNRMMAKIHLMGFDESLKHRVRNDLESEQFPEYLMVDVPDKLPKRNVTKKLSQAEARLERFKNANAKRSSNNAPKASATTGAAVKRRTEQMLPARSSSRGSETADGTASSGSARSGAWERARGNPGNAKDPPSAPPPVTARTRAFARSHIAGDEAGRTRRESPDTETLRRSDDPPPRGSPGRFGKAPAAAWRSSSVDNYFKSLTSDGKIIMRRGANPRSALGVDLRSASGDRQTRRETRASRSTSSPGFLRREGERSTTSMTVDRGGARAPTVSSLAREILTRRSGRAEEKTSTTSIDRKYAELTRDERSPSPQFSSAESRKSDATVTIGREEVNLRPTSADRQTRADRSTSPEFFCREDERSATTMTLDREGSTSSYDRETLAQQSRQSEESVDRRYAEITRHKRSPSLPFFLKESGRSSVGLRSASADRQTRETRASSSTSPEFFCREGERSATTMMIDQRVRAPTLSSRAREMLTKQNRRTAGGTMSIDRKSYAEIARRNERSPSPLSRLFPREPGKTGATVSRVGRKDINLRSISADRSPEFLRREAERSATSVMVDRGAGFNSSRDRDVSTKQNKRTEEVMTSIDRKYAEITRDKRSPSRQFFLRESGKSDATLSIDRKNIKLRSTSADHARQTRTSPSPEFFRKEGERSATTMTLARGRSTSSRDRETSSAKQGRRAEGATTSLDRRYAEITRDKRSPSSRFFYNESEKSAGATLIERKSSSTETAKSILRRRRHTSDTSYKPLAGLSSPRNKGARATRVRHTPSPSVAKSEAKRGLKRDEASLRVVRSDSRRSSKISEASATSASSIVSLKYGLEFDNILQSAGLVRKFMKTQNGGQRDKVQRLSPSKRDIKSVSARTGVRNEGQARNRYKVSALSQKSRSPSGDSKGRATPEYSRKSVTPTEIDVEIQEITMTDHRMERYEPRKESSSEQSKSSPTIDFSNVSSASRKIIPPTKGYGRRHDVKSKTPARLSPLRRATRRGADVLRTSFSRRVADQESAFKYSTYTIKDSRRKRQSLLAAKEGSSPDSIDDKSKDTAREFPKTTRREDESGKDIERMDSLTVQESTSRPVDSVTGRSESSARASSEISLRTMNAQTKTPAEELKASARSTADSGVTRTSATLRSTLRPAKTGKGASKVEHVARTCDLKTTLSKVIRPSGRMTKTYRSSAASGKPVSTQRRSPTCKRQLFESDSEKETRSVRTSWNFARTRKKETHFSADVRSRRDAATTSKVVKSLGGFDVAKRSSRRPEETPVISVKPLRSIEDIRRSIDCHERSALTATKKRSRSAIASWRSSTSRESGDARRTISASGTARRVSPEDQPARLTKVQSCVQSRIAKSPSPDARSPRKQHETNARATRGSAPSSPSKSPDNMHVAPRRGSTEPKNPDARPARRSVVARAAESIGNKTTTGAADTIDGVVQRNDSSHESATKKSDAFVIDLDDRPKESDTTPPKKATSMRRSSTDKYPTTSSASGRPTSSVSSNFSSAGTAHSQTSSTKSRMATKTKTPVSGGSQARGPSSARTGNVNSGDNLTTCNTCGRSFAQDRVSLHEQICAKTMNKKRKQFDAMTFRVRGTELEPFVKKGIAKKQESNTKKPGLKSNWRRKHEEFIEAIRSAKMVQSHLAAGGSLKDLPPPPPSDTSDYIQCPHCGRRFNQAAAERHIPKCEHMLHNKPAHARAARTRR
ncbi:uncharacterized protein LOC105191682 isoform X1 [Harpegnathos saltator]|uniref:uncharacterized protein LOC105191682 isoform X1 n=2 Tax=Harpegnathos saltator TaxID=610380 RepID=UPI000DBEDCF8|nr:uncharacterized protein LOC105191682 isoform X1 [Harpegnathos saltator]